MGSSCAKSPDSPLRSDCPMATAEQNENDRRTTMAASSSDSLEEDRGSHVAPPGPCSASSPSSGLGISLLSFSSACVGSKASQRKKKHDPTAADGESLPNEPAAAASGPEASQLDAEVKLDEETAERLRKFYQRNRRENQRHATMIEQSQGSSVMERLLTESEGGREKIELYDVFSPDMRSTRWQEFLELFAQNADQFDRFKENSRAVRGSGKAMTLAGVTRGPQEDLGRLH